MCKQFANTSSPTNIILIHICKFENSRTILIPIRTDVGSSSLFFFRFAGKIRSTVPLRFRKSISGHYFQNTRKFANNDFQYRKDVIYSV